MKSKPNYVTWLGIKSTKFWCKMTSQLTEPWCQSNSIFLVQRLTNIPDPAALCAVWLLNSCPLIVWPVSFHHYEYGPCSSISFSDQYLGSLAHVSKHFHKCIHSSLTASMSGGTNALFPEEVAGAEGWVKWPVHLHSKSHDQHPVCCVVAVSTSYLHSPGGDSTHHVVSGLLCWVWDVPEEMMIVTCFLSPTRR